MLCFSFLQNSHSLLDLPQVNRRNGNKVWQSNTRLRVLAPTRGKRPCPLWHHKHLIRPVVNSRTLWLKSGASKKQRTDIHVTVKKKTLGFFLDGLKLRTGINQPAVYLQGNSSVYFSKSTSFQHLAPLNCLWRRLKTNSCSCKGHAVLIVPFLGNHPPTLNPHYPPPTPPTPPWSWWSVPAVRGWTPSKDTR